MSVKTLTHGDFPGVCGRELTTFTAWRSTHRRLSVSLEFILRVWPTPGREESREVEHQDVEKMRVTPYPAQQSKS